MVYIGIKFVLSRLLSAAHSYSARAYSTGTRQTRQTHSACSTYSAYSTPRYQPSGTVSAGLQSPPESGWFAEWLAATARRQRPASGSGQKSVNANGNSELTEGARSISRSPIISTGTGCPANVSYCSNA